MPGIQPNKSWFRYVDNAGRNWGIQADTDWGAVAASGLAAFNSTDPPFGPQSRRHHVRKAIYRDPVTFRARVLPVGTVAADAALPATLAVVIQGQVTTVTYNLSGRVPEKLSVPQTSRHLIDTP
jgi:hypothetical protein